MAISDNEVWIGVMDDYQEAPCQIRKLGNVYIRMYPLGGLGLVHLDVFAEEPRYTNGRNMLMCCTLD